MRFHNCPGCQRHITANATEELKLDGFRALAYLENGEGRLVSRNGNTFASFRDLAADVAASFRGADGVLDGEIVCLDEHGCPQFEDRLSHPMHHGAIVPRDREVLGERLWD